ncbi:MAG: hypothetical protein GF332_02710 [Candidatus Moranbacteria bacterium]|nr:hypothetical protein [Candidatus Moranbacteria bacterium]
MRNFRNPGIQVSKNQKLDRIGKFCLLILVLVVMFFLYNQTEAQNQEETPTSVLFNNQKKPEPADKIASTIELGAQDVELTLKNQEQEQTEQEQTQTRRLTFRGSSYYNTNSEDYETVEQNLALLKAISAELEGTKMEPMIETIANFDQETAALIVGIAKIESGFNRCNGYNCWGYAGGGLYMSDPVKAVKLVGKKIQQYNEQGLNTPSKIVYIWKCGDSSCATHSKESVSRWINTSTGPWRRIMNCKQD